MPLRHHSCNYPLLLSSLALGSFIVFFEGRGEVYRICLTLIIRVSLHIYVCKIILKSINSIDQSMYVSTYLSSIYLSTHLSIHLSIYLSSPMDKITAESLLNPHRSQTRSYVLLGSQVAWVPACVVCDPKW